ncbi:hypothetical protein HUU53_03245 [Candidatus Micrarchaeota archaeon]|nr:hypothetical protein [Candidatus Micrarchaeota archaeon]
MKGHTSSMYLDVALMGIGAILVLTNDIVTGIIIAGIGLGIHTVMGD